MGGKRFLLVFGLLGGSASGLVTATLLDALDPSPFPWVLYLAVVAINVIGFTVGGWLTWLRWARSRQQARARVIAQLAVGNLATQVSAGESQEDVRRLILSLRRALFQVQRVTASLQRTGKGVGEQSQALLEAARRQGAAVDRSLGSVQGMGSSLQVAGERLTQVAAFAEETTTALAEMTVRIEQVASALGTLDSFALRTTERVQIMSEGLSAVASSGDVLARFAGEAAAFVTSVEEGIDAVRRRAGETGDLARVVTSTAERGESLVNDSVQGMYRVEESIRRAAEIVEALGQRSQRDRPHRRRHPGGGGPDQPPVARTPRSSPPRPASRGRPSGWWPRRSARSPSAPRGAPGRSGPSSARRGDRWTRRSPTCRRAASAPPPAWPSAIGPPRR